MNSQSGADSSRETQVRPIIITHLLVYLKGRKIFWSFALRHRMTDFSKYLTQMHLITFVEKMREFWILKFGFSYRIVQWKVRNFTMSFVSLIRNIPLISAVKSVSKRILSAIYGDAISWYPLKTQLLAIGCGSCMKRPF